MKRKSKTVISTLVYTERMVGKNKNTGPESVIESDINIHGLRVFENRILRRIFGPKRDESGEWTRLHNEELHSSPNIVRVIKSRRLRWGGDVAGMEYGRSAIKMLTGKTFRKA